MNKNIVVIFLFLATVFAMVHALALSANLYWYLPWFDIMMHFWGGILIGLGIHSLSTFSRLHFRPTLGILLLALFILTSTWEVFEWWTGMWQPDAYLFDTAQDIVLGFGGGLLAHSLLRTYTMK